MKTLHTASRRAGSRFACLLLLAPFATSFALASEVLFSSDGSSLEPFSCHYVSDEIAPTIDPTEGLDAPALLFSTQGIANYSFAPYVLPPLSPGQVVHGSLDFKIDGETNLVEIAGFGVSTGAGCDYSADTGPADGRWPIPSVYYYSADGVIGIVSRNQVGDVESRLLSFPISLGSWHHSDFTFAPASDGAYDFELRIDGASAVSGKSYEELLGHDAVGVLLGAVGSGYQTRVEYDNVHVEVVEEEPACVFGPTGQPVTFVRGFGRSVVETTTWESCGGAGAMVVAVEGISSAEVFLNGSRLLGQRDFNRNVAHIEVPVVLLEGQNRLDVEIRSRPGSRLAVTFVPSPAAGSEAPELEPVGAAPDPPPRPGLPGARRPMGGNR